MESNDLIRCKACNELKPKTEFLRHSRAKTGHMSICKSCQSARIRVGKCTPNSVAPPCYMLPTRNMKNRHHGSLLLHSERLLRNLRPVDIAIRVN